MLKWRFFEVPVFKSHILFTIAGRFHHFPSTNLYPCVLVSPDYKHRSHINYDSTWVCVRECAVCVCIPASTYVCLSHCGYKSVCESLLPVQKFLFLRLTVCVYLLPVCVCVYLSVPESVSVGVDVCWVSVCLTVCICEHVCVFASISMCLCLSVNLCHYLCVCWCRYVSVYTTVCVSKPLCMCWTLLFIELGITTLYLHYFHFQYVDIGLGMESIYENSAHRCTLWFFSIIVSILALF